MYACFWTRLVFLPVYFDPRNHKALKKGKKQNNFIVSEVQVVLQKSSKQEKSVGRYVHIEFMQLGCCER